MIERIKKSYLEMAEEEPTAFLAVYWLGVCGWICTSAWFILIDVETRLQIRQTIKEFDGFTTFGTLCIGIGGFAVVIGMVVYVPMFLIHTFFVSPRDGQ